MGCIPGTQLMSNKTLLQLALIFLLAIWGASIVLTFFDSAYKPPEGITGVMTGLAGAIVYALTRSPPKDEQRHDDDSNEGGGGRE